MHVHNFDRYDKKKSFELFVWDMTSFYGRIGYKESMKKFRISSLPALLLLQRTENIWCKVWLELNFEYILSFRKGNLENSKRAFFPLYERMRMQIINLFILLQRSKTWIETKTKKMGNKATSLTLDLRVVTMTTSYQENICKFKKGWNKQKFYCEKFGNECMRNGYNEWKLILCFQCQFSLDSNTITIYSHRRYWRDVVVCYWKM